MLLAFRAIGGRLSVDENRFDEVAKLVAEGGAPVDETADESMPRRAALGLVGGLAGLAGLAAFAGSSNTASAQVSRVGQLTRVRNVVESTNVPNNSNRVLNMICPNPRSNERVFVMGGGFTHNPFRLAFAIRTS